MTTGCPGDLCREENNDSVLCNDCVMYNEYLLEFLQVLFSVLTAARC